MSPAAEPSPTQSPVPAAYWIWLIGLAWTSVGVNLLAFGMVWMAASHSATLAGLVLLATAAPRFTLTQVGGAVADRVGPIRMMIAADSIMAALTAAAAATALLVGPHPALLISAAAVLGLADAFYQPATGSVPKLLVAREGLPRAMAARQVVIYIASVLGLVLGGVAQCSAARCLCDDGGFRVLRASGDRHAAVTLFWGSGAALVAVGALLSSAVRTARR